MLRATFASGTNPSANVLIFSGLIAGQILGPGVAWEHDVLEQFKLNAGGTSASIGFASVQALMSANITAQVTELPTLIENAYTTLALRQTALEPAISEAIYENVWDLYRE